MNCRIPCLILVILGIVAGSPTASIALQTQSESEETQQSDRERYERYKKFVDDICPLENGWERSIKNHLHIPESLSGCASHGKFLLFGESENSLWIYCPDIGTSKTEADINNFRLSAYGLNAEKEVSKIKSIFPVRLASNQAETSVTMLEFQIDLSDLNVIPGNRLLPPEILEDSDIEIPPDCVLVFLETRDEASCEKDESATTQSSSDKNMSQEVQENAVDEEQLLEAEANALDQHTSTLWLLPPQQLRAFEKRVISPKDLNGHVSLRRQGNRMIVAMYGITDRKLRGTPGLVVMGPEGNEIIDTGETRGMMQIPIKGTENVSLFYSCMAIPVKALPDYGTIGITEGD